MPTDAPDKANVIALPPLIVGAPWRWGLLLHFVWLIRFLARTDALWLGALLIVVSIRSKTLSEAELRHAVAAARAGSSAPQAASAGTTDPPPGNGDEVVHGYRSL